MAKLSVSPDWVHDDGPRVLVEAAEWERRSALSRALRDHGYAVACCAGPEGAGERCSLAAGCGCAAADEAACIVHTLRPTDLRNLEALRALRSRYPGTPIVVEVPEAWVEDHQTDYEGCIVVPMPMNDDAMLAAVGLAIDGA